MKTHPSISFDHRQAQPWADEIMTRSGQNLTACYQCRRCAAGCPVARASDYLTPNRLIRLIVLGDRQAALDNALIWKCVSCYTCGTRCPNDIQTARITDTLKKMNHAAHLAPQVPEVAFFHRAFFKTGLQWGRVNEMALMGGYEVRCMLNYSKRFKLTPIYREMRRQGRLAWAMQRRRRLHFRFQTSRGRKELKGLRAHGVQRKGSPQPTPETMNYEP